MQLQNFNHSPLLPATTRRPLSKIQTFSKRSIEVEKYSTQTEAYFNRITAASERMQNLLVSLLDFSRTDKIDLIIVTCYFDDDDYD